MNRYYPCIEVDLDKIRHNAEAAIIICKGIDITGVTKVVCSNLQIVKTFIEAGIKTIGDSRILNLKKIKDFPCQKMLLRIPSKSQVEDVVRYSDISLNSDIDVIREISRECVKQEKVHKIILMLEMGDLREGVMPYDAVKVSREIVELPGIQFIGVGTNLTCYGGVIPDNDNLGRLIKTRDHIEEELGIKLPVISGGNSSSMYKVVEGTMPEQINSLRLGESILLGHDTAYFRKIPGMYEDAFIVKAEVIEREVKPSVPYGDIGLDAFGNKPKFEDRGYIKRVILAIGRQDVKVSGLIPKDRDIKIIGASSDHLIADVTNSSREYKTGDIVEFGVDYGALLACMTSEYISKYINSEAVLV